MLKFLSFFFLPCLFYHSSSLSLPQSNQLEASPLNFGPSFFSPEYEALRARSSENDSLSLSLSLYVGMWVSMCGEALNYNNNNKKMNGPLWCVSEREFGQKVKVKLWNHVLPNALCCESCDWCTLKSVIILCFSLSHVVTCSPSQASFVYTFLIQTVLSFLFKDSCVPRHNF